MLPLYDINPTTRFAFVTYAIIGLNLLVLLWELSLSPADREALIAHHGFVPARVAQLSDPNQVVKVPVEPQEVEVRPGVMAEVERDPIELSPAPKEIYLSLLTCMFLHAGWMHLIGNMWFLHIFGDNIEDRLGHFVFAAFYLIGGLAASALHWLTDPASVAPVIGASGAIAAVLGAYAVTFPKTRVLTLVFLFVFITVVQLPALIVLGFWFVAQLLDGLLEHHLNVSGGVAFWAHVGGFATGAALMPILSAILPPPTPPPSPFMGEVRGEGFDVGPY